MTRLRHRAEVPRWWFAVIAVALTAMTLGVIASQPPVRSILDSSRHPGPVAQSQSSNSPMKTGCAAGDGPAGQSGASLEPRQLWVWQPVSPKDLMAVARRYAITQLLVWVPPDFTANHAEVAHYRALLASAKSAGMQLDALGGDPTWAEEPEIATTWADEVRDSKLFARLHLDIEPYALPAWRTNRAPLVQGLMAALASARATGMPVDADIPYWYNTVKIASGEYLDTAVMQAVNSVTIMAYRNTAAGVLSVAAAEMAHADGLAEAAWIGVNAAQQGSDPPSTTFYGQTAKSFDCAMSALETEARQWSAFAGISIQDYQGLAALSGFVGPAKMESDAVRRSIVLVGNTSRTTSSD